MPPSLRKNFAWTLAGNLVFALCQWATIIAITKLSSVQVAGDWILGLAITAPIFIFAQFKLRIVQSSDARGENRWGEYVSVRLIGMIGALIAVGLVVGVAYRDETGLLILVIALFKIFDAGSDLVYGLEQQRERMDAISISQTVRALTSTALGIAVFWSSESPILTAAVTAASYLVCLVWDVARVRGLLGGEPLGPSWDRERVGRLLRRIMPLGFAAAITALQVAIPRYFLEGYVSRGELGVFGALSYLPVFGAMVITAMSYAALPRMSGFAAREDWSSFRRQLLQLTALGIGFGALATLACILVGETVLRIIYSPEVAAHADILVWLVVGASILWARGALGTALDAMRSFAIQPWIHALSTVVIAIGCLILVRPYGLTGAAAAILIGYAAEAILFVIAVAIPLRRRQSAPQGLP